MSLALEGIIGVVLSLPFIGFAKNFPAERAKKILALSLVGAALIYVVFALAGLRSDSDFTWVLVELAGLLVYGSMAVFALRYSAWLLVAGWSLHSLWDIALHSESAFVPSFYPGICLGFDLSIAVFAAFMLFRKNGK